jgi:hypothetical protein
MPSKEQHLPEGFDTYDSVAEAQKHNLETWDSTGQTTLYSTGMKKLDQYLGGGFGKEGDFEIVLIHSQPKTYKSTLALMFMIDAVKRGVPQGWVILEGSLAEALNRLRRCFYPYEEFDKLIPTMDKCVFAMSKKMRRSNYTLGDILKWMKYLHATKGVNLFFIDPLGYAFDFSTRDPYENEWSRQARFMQELSAFGEDTNSTIVLVQHNTKDSSGPNASYRAAAVGGSATLTKAATKTIEIRKEKDEVTSTGERFRRIAIEMYFSRHGLDHARQPLMMDIYQRNDGKGLSMFIPMFTEESAENAFGEKTEKGRSVWYGQIDSNENDLKELMDE